MAKSPRYRRWTADTEIAFLLALRLYGNVARACAEIGRSTHGAQDRRKRMPAFDAKWQAMLDAWQAAAVAERQAGIGADDPGVMPNRVRYDGFTPIRQRAFLRVLTETGSVKDACARVGISQAAATRARRTYPSFSAAWDRAETHCEADLEQIAIERAIDGIEQEVAVGGQLVKRTVYPEGTMRTLLGMRERRARDEKAEQARGGKAGLGYAPVTKEDTIAAIMKKLDALEAHDARQKADAAARVWAAWQATWGSFGRGGIHLGEVEQEVLPALTLEDDDWDEAEAMERV